MRIKFRRVDSLADEIARLQERIATRALEIFRARGSGVGHALEDWLRAERETVWRPAIEVMRTKDAFVVQAAVAGVDPKRLDVRVTPTELWLGADVHHSDQKKDGDVLLCEFVNGPLIRTWHFPEPVDPAHVSAQCRNGMLTVIAPLAGTGRSVTVTAA
jgi:HSP20 family molecular chaperone IbpA